MYSLIFSFNDTSDLSLSSWVCVDDFIELITSSTSHMLSSMESTFDFSDFKSALSLIKGDNILRHIQDQFLLLT